MTIRYISRFGSSGTGAGEFSAGPYSINVDSSGYIWARDKDGSSVVRVQKFTSGGTYSTGFTCPEVGAYPKGMAVSPSPSYNFVYIIEYDDGYVHKYSKTGTYLGYFDTGETSVDGIAADVGGYVYTTHAASSRLKKWTSPGIAVTNWGSAGTGHGEFNGISLVSLNKSTGNVYALDFGAAGDNRIQQFTNTGTWISQFDGDDDDPEDGWQTIINMNDFCVDNAGNIYLDCGPNNRRIQKYDTSYTFVEFFGSDGEDIGQFNNVRSVAYNPVSDQICAGDYGNGNISLWSPTSATGDKVVIHSNTRGNPFLSLLNSVVVGDKVSILTGTGGTFCRKV